MNDVRRGIARRKYAGALQVGAGGNTLTYTDPAAGRADIDETGAEDVTWFVVSTADVDRDGDVVRPDGWDVQNFLGNGAPWLFDHGETDSRPIGRAVHPSTGEPLLRFEDGRVLAGIAWDSGEWGREIKGLVDRGLLCGASIGFLPKDGRRINSPGRLGKQGRGGYQIDSLDLLELTITPTPANPNAMRLAIDRGELSAVVTKSIRKAMGTMSDTAGGTLVADGKDEEHKSETESDMGAHMKSLQDCVSAKIKYLMDHGEAEDEKQAAAMAYKHCGEKHLTASEDAPVPEKIEKDKKSAAPCGDCNGHVKTKAADPGTQDVEPVQPTSEEGSAPAVVEPHGVVSSRNCIEHLQALLDYVDNNVLPALEPDSDIKTHFEQLFRPVVDEVMSELKDKAHSLYPDHGFEGEDYVPDEADEDEAKNDEAETVEDQEGPDGTAANEEGEADLGSGEEDAEDMSDEEEEEIADRYTRAAAYRAKAAGRKGYRMGKAAMEVCAKAADHMDEVSDHLEKSSDHPEIPAEMGYMHKGFALAHRKHAMAMRKAVGYGEPGLPKEHEDGGSMEEKPADDPATHTEYKSVGWSDVLGELRGVRRELDHARGKR